MEQKKKHYYAFISHSSEDAKTAKWLCNQLEEYHIPTMIQKEYHAPKRLKPIFLFQTDLSGNKLREALEGELNDSQFLIVICSPSAAKSEYVNKEVKHFINSGHYDKIIPFIVDGIPFSSLKGDFENECFPPALVALKETEQELRGIDLREEQKHRGSKNAAVIDVIASMLGVRMDVLWDRYKSGKKRKITILSAIFVMIAFVLYCCWFHFLHTQYEYFVDMADCKGMPTGIIQIRNDDAQNHYRLYRFEKRMGLLQRVIYVDGNGNPQNHTNTEFADRPCIQELSYKDGKLMTIDCKDATNKTLYIMHLAKNAMSADLKDEDEDLSANFIFSSTSVDQGQASIMHSEFIDRLLTHPSKIGRFIYERDDDGFIKKKIYAKNNADNDDIGMDANCISGFEYERDSLHRVIKICFLDKNYQYKSNRLGIAGKRYQYDEYGNLAIVEYVDKNGSLKYNELHWAKSVDIYDSKGFCLEERVFGINGEPCVSAFGCHKIIISTNKNCETSSLYDIHDNPTYSLPYGESLGGYSKITKIRNNLGQIIAIHYKDANGNVCYNQNHVAINKFEYDENGYITDIRNYGADNMPCSDIIGCFHTHYSYNERGNITEMSLFNINEKPIQNNMGIHKILTKYDNVGERIIEVHAYNIENYQIPCKLLGGAAWIKLGYRGSSKWVSEISFYGLDNQLMETTVGAKVVCERNSNGQITEYKYYNADGELSSNDIHCAIMELEYNEMGMETNRCFYDENRKPTSNTSGVFRISSSYTLNGQIERICVYDTLNHLHNCSEGWAIKETNYKNGMVSTNYVFGENEERIEVMGVHKYLYEIDDCGYVISVSAFDKNLKPTINQQIGAYKVVNVYDEQKRDIGKDYYDVIHTDPFVCIRIKLNERGLPIEQTAYNASEGLIESPLNYGVAKLQSEFDSHDRITHMCATDRKGKKVNMINGFAESFFYVDNEVYEVVFLDSIGNITNNISLTNPIAYQVLYMSETGQRLFSKIIQLTYDDDYEIIRDIPCYYSQEKNSMQAIRCDDNQVIVFDFLENRHFTFNSSEEEFDEYHHIVDSIQNEFEVKYGKPKLYKYIEHIMD